MTKSLQTLKDSMVVVSNTTPIISLSSVGQIQLLNALFHEIYIPDAVYLELKAKKGFGYKEVDFDFFKRVSVEGNIYKSFLLNQLDLGETETILLAKELNSDLVLIDENIAYRIAKNSELKPFRTLSILLLAKEKGLITKCQPIVEEMILKGRWYSERVYKLFLEKAGEI